MSTATPAPVGFLHLPIEIRWMIYEHAMSNTRVAAGWSGTWDFGRRELERTPFALLRTCKRVYADIIDTWPQWCIIDLGPLQRYNSARMLDVLAAIPTNMMSNLQTLCMPAFHIKILQPAPQQDKVYNGFSFFSIFKQLNLKRLLLRWDDTISSPSSPNGHDYQYAVTREQLVQYGVGWRELYLATPFEVLAETLDREIKRRDGIDSGSSASLQLVKRDYSSPLDEDSDFRSIYDAVSNSSPKGSAHVVVVTRGQGVNIHEPPVSTPVINDIHMRIQWFRGSDSSADCSSYSSLRRSFVG